MSANKAMPYFWTPKPRVEHLGDVLRDRNLAMTTLPTADGEVEVTLTHVSHGPVGVVLHPAKSAMAKGPDFATAVDTALKKYDEEAR